ncbi:MAG: FkbM family methyltransferase [Sedimentisphaerales bacterium]|nr:FkbM family methyltransferase [Sedimentisphaerales bacterium]
MIKDKVKKITFNLFGQRIFTKLQSIYWVERLKRGRFYEDEVDILPYFVNPGSTCIDIGANCGQYAYRLSKLVGTYGKVLSIEPAKDARKILKSVIKNLKLSNVEVKSMALADKEGEVELVTPLDEQKLPNIGEAHLCGKTESPNGERLKVKCTSLDKVASELESPDKVTFIKCDVEGSELMVLKGGRELLSRHHPVILCEIEERHTKRYGYVPDVLFDFLKDLGYEAFVLVSGKLTQVKSVQESTINYVFIHKNSVLKPNNIFRAERKHSGEHYQKQSKKTFS